MSVHNYKYYNFPLSKFQNINQTKIKVNDVDEMTNFVTLCYTFVCERSFFDILLPFCTGSDFCQDDPRFREYLSTVK